MWALVESGNVSTIYKQPKSLTIGDVQYPRNIFNLWTSSQLESLGIYEVVIDNSNLKDTEYYFNNNQTFAFADDVYPEGHSSAGDRVNTWSEGDVKTPGLKTNHKAAINQQAYELLLSNDWMVVKATETGESVASAWTTYRAGVRTAAASMVTKINAVSDVDALAALYVYNNATPQVRPLGKFPDVPTS